MNLVRPAVLSAYAGRNDGSFCKLLGEQGLGMVTIGGICVDDISKKQSRKMVERGRSEFLVEDHKEFIKNEVELAKESGAIVAVNVRSATLEGYLDAANAISESGGVMEIDAHCRQPEINEIGAGQSLLSDIDRLEEILKAIKSEHDMELILKFRGNVVSERELALRLGDHCNALHVDAMKEGIDSFDSEVFLNIPDWIYLIGNNSVKDAKSALAVLEFCDAFSFARLANDLNQTRAMIEQLW